MKKFIYGKEVHLSRWINGYAGIRLSDLDCYSLMENDLMRDDEMVKKFHLDKDSFTFTINGHQINPRDVVGHIMVEIPVDPCFCVCLTGKCNDPELFERFKADVCVEVHVEQLVRLLEAGIQRLEGAAVVHGPVNYYPEPLINSSLGFGNALFYKPDRYSVEDEYRVAITIPRNKRSVKGPGGEVVELWSDDPRDKRHLFVFDNDRESALSYISTVYRNTNIQ